MFVDVFPVLLYVPTIKIPLSVKVKAIPYANLRTSHLIGGAWTRAFLCKWVFTHELWMKMVARRTPTYVINRSRDHSFFIRSLQNPTLEMSRIAQHVNTTQTAIMSAWHYCFIPPICSSRLYILITISKHDAWSPKVFLFDGNECHPAPCIPSSRNF